MATLCLQSVHKSFGSVLVVHCLDLSVADREFVVLVGPSGCGKSTILRMIAGLEDVTEGRILIDDQVVNHREPKDRDVAMVFQDYALYPHMSVFENMAFGLRYRRIARNEIRARVEAAARVLEILPLLDRSPRQLSGGQRQRVAMGRAIVREPRIFLFDEPLSNLDAKLRGQMRTELKKLRARVATTTVYVTHDQTEAMTLADRIVVLNAGVVEQVGSPEDVYERPASTFVAAFMGAPPMNLLPALLTDGGTDLMLADGTLVPLPLLSPDLKHATFDTPQMIDIVERLAKATATPAIDKISWTGRWVEPLGAFASGHVGMLHAHAPAYRNIQGQGPWVNEATLGVAQMPGNWSVPSSHGLGISQQSRNPELAWEFVSFITDRTQALAFARAFKVLTGYTEVDRTLLAEMATQDPLGAKVLDTQLQFTDRMCGNWRLGNDSQVKDAFWPELQGALLGNRDAKKAMAEAGHKVDRVLRSST